MGIMGIFKSKESKEMIQDAMDGKALLLDVRTKSEFASDHVNGSKNIPLDQINNKIESIKAEGKSVVVCCMSGARSGMANKILKSAGIKSCNGGSYRNFK